MESETPHSKTEGRSHIVAVSEGPQDKAATDKAGEAGASSWKVEKLRCLPRKQVFRN